MPTNVVTLIKYQIFYIQIVPLCIQPAVIRILSAPVRVLADYLAPVLKATIYCCLSAAYNINLTPMKKLVILFVCTGLSYAVLASNILSKPAARTYTLPLSGADSIPAAPTYHFQVFKQSNNSFGYDVYAGPKKMIHQETIPGYPGNLGFTTGAAASKVAGLVIRKLQKNIFPPTVSTEELKQLHVL